MLRGSSIHRIVRRLTPLSFRNVPSAGATLAHQRRFHALGVSDELTQKLSASGITTPTPVQQQAIPVILQGQNDVVIAAETGGGKTLAYLIPVLDQLRRHALPLDQIHRPVALILTTSQELVGQIMNVMRAIDPEMARLTTALSSTNQQLPQRFCPVLVATPKALLRVSKPNDFAFTRLIVVDEADMLLGGGFEKDTKQIVATIRNQPLKKDVLNQWSIHQQQEQEDEEITKEEEISSDPRQTVFSAWFLFFFVEYATIPDYGKRSVRGFITHKFPDAHYAVTEDFHRTLPGLDIEVHQLEDSSTDDQPRMELLAKILANTSTTPPMGNTLVFANSIDSANALHQYLTTTTTTATRTLLYHKEIPRDERQKILEILQNPEVNVVVICTDIAARGLDTTTVRHVVQYEFAHDVVSYIHRIGRTARAGTTGKVSSIVTEENALVFSKIQDAGSASLNGAFSRKRSLRKKVKKARREDHGPR